MERQSNTYGEAKLRRGRRSAVATTAHFAASFAVGLMVLAGIAAGSQDDVVLAYDGAIEFPTAGSWGVLCWSKSGGGGPGLIRVDTGALEAPSVAPERVPKLRAWLLTAAPVYLNARVEPDESLWLVMGKSGSRSRRSEVEPYCSILWSSARGFLGEPTWHDAPPTSRIEWGCWVPGDGTHASAGAGRVAVGGSLWEATQQVGFWSHVLQVDEALGVSVVPDSEMPAPFSLAASADQFHVGTSTLPDGHPAHTFLVRSDASAEPRLWHLRRDTAREFPLSSAMHDAIGYVDGPGVRIVPVVSTADNALALVFRPVPNQPDHLAFFAHGASGRIGESMIRKYPSGVAYGAAEDSSGKLAIVVAPGGHPGCDAMWVERDRLTTFPVLDGVECDALGSNWGQRLSLRAMDGEPGQFRLNAIRCGYFSPNARVWYYDLQRGEGGSVSATLRLTLGQDGKVVGAVGEGAQGDR